MCDIQRDQFSLNIQCELIKIAVKKKEKNKRAGARKSLFSVEQCHYEFIAYIFSILNQRSFILNKTDYSDCSDVIISGLGV